jgi:hypothetical protein
MACLILNNRAEDWHASSGVMTEITEHFTALCLVWSEWACKQYLQAPCFRRGYLTAAFRRTPPERPDDRTGHFGD